MRHTELRGIDLGRVDAEADIRLREYFVTTPYVSEALHGKRTLFIGRKGSGKSALYQQLPLLYRRKRLRDLVVVPITPDEHAWMAVKQYREAGMLAEAAYTNAWLYALCAHLAIAISDLRREWQGRSRSAAAALRQFVDQNYREGHAEFARLASHLVNGLTSINFSALGFGVGAAWRPEERQIGLAAARSVHRLLEVVGFCLDEIGAVVLLDRLDDCWDGSQEAQDALIGLLKAAKRLNDQLPLSDDSIRGVKVLTFLRSDIYSRLRFDDKDKHRPLEEPLVWNEDELADLINKRLPSGMTLNDVFDERLGPAQWKYILERTFLRPRDVLEYMGECFRLCRAHQTRLTPKEVTGAEERYSTWKVDDLRQEFAKSRPYFPDILECLRQGPDRYESFSELSFVVANRKFRLVKDYTERGVLEALFDASVVGFKMGPQDDEPTFRCEVENLVLPADSALYIHPGLHRGLNVMSRRSWQLRYGLRDDR